MATEENLNGLEEESVQKQPETPKPTQFPHQVLMNKTNLTSESLNDDAKDCLGDFEDFLKHVKLAKSSSEKKGIAYQLPDSKKNKLIRLSKSVCREIQISLDNNEDERRNLEEQRNAQRNRFIELERGRRKDEALRVREEDAQKRRDEHEKLLKEQKEQQEQRDEPNGFFF